MNPCRDCAKPTPASARSCPHCGILNPVVQWVAFPDGSHVTTRVAPDPVAAAAALAGKPAPRPAAAPRPAPAARPAPAPTPAPGATQTLYGGPAPAATQTMYGGPPPAGQTMYGGPPPAATQTMYGEPAPSRTSAAPDPFAIFAPGGAAPLPMAAAALPGGDFGDEVDAINKCSTAFFWLAGLNAVIGMLFREMLGNAFLIEVAIMAGLSLALRRYRSRVAAVLLVAYSAFTVLVKVMALMDGGGRIGWIWLWVLVTGLAGKAAMATFKLHGQRPAGALA